MALFSDQRPWRQFLFDLPIVPNPRKRFYPTTLQDLVTIVQQTEASTPPIPPLHAVGSHWAPCEAAVNRDGIVVESNDPGLEPNPPQPPRAYNKTLFNVVGKNGCLSPEALDFFRNQGVGPFDPSDASELPPASGGLDVGFKKFFLGHFEAGTRIYELYDRLDHGLDDPNSLTASPDFANYAGPWAVPTLGGSGGQTIGGVISTATHGGDIFLGPIADAIQALHIVGPEGKQYWIERSLVDGQDIPLTSATALQSQFGQIEVHREEDFFNAAIVSVGRLGIIYSVVLRVVRQFALSQSTKKDPDTWQDVKARIANVRANFADKRFLQVVINPNGRPDDHSTHTCFLTTRNTQALAAATPMGTTQPNGRAERSGANAGNSDSYKSDMLSNLLCRNASSRDLDHWFDPLVTAIKVVFTGAEAAALLAAASTNAELAALIAANLPLAAVIAVAAAVAGLPEWALRKLAELAENIGPLHDDAEKVLGAFDAVDIVTDVVTHRGNLTIGGMLAAICNRFVAADRAEYLRFTNEFFIKQGGRPEDMTAISYAVMDGHSYLDNGCTTRGVSLEAFVNAETGPVAQLVETIFDKLEQLEAGTLPRANGQKLAFAGYLALRFMKASRALIAMQQDDMTCSLELSGLGGCKGNDIFMAEIAETAVGMGARLHWGQFNDNIGADAIEASYGDKLTRWRRVLAQMSRNGRQPTFSTPFTVKKGLEVVDPAVTTFMMSPHFGVTGGPGSLLWDIGDNPPGTTARLIVTPEGGPPTETNLAGTHGEMPMPVHAGQTEYAIAADFTFNGKVHTTRAVKEIFGFDAAHPFWRVLQAAVLGDVDGHQQYAVRFLLIGGDWTPNLVFEEIAVTFGNADAGVTWSLRGPNGLQLDFNRNNAVQELSDRPPAVGTEDDQEWLFLHSRAGQPTTSGPPPVLDVRFRVSSS